MDTLSHVLNTSTLATWLSVASFGTVGIVVPDWRLDPPPAKPATVVETQWADPEFVLDDPGPASAPETSLPAAPADLAAAEPLPSPPPLAPEPADEALPDIPDLPPTPAPAAPAVASTPREPTAKATASPRSRSSASPRPTQSAHATQGSSAATGTPGGSSMGDSARIAAGRMPKPSYPQESIRKRQTGTVLVEFTVDSTGRVIAAHAKSPTQWPLLNDAAVRAVRRWKFPPGGVMKLERPITFQLP